VALNPGAGRSSPAGCGRQANTLCTLQKDTDVGATDTCDTKLIDAIAIGKYLVVIAIFCQIVSIITIID
jgi:hypothetical protein